MLAVALVVFERMELVCVGNNARNVCSGSYSTFVQLGVSGGDGDLGFDARVP